MSRGTRLAGYKEERMGVLQGIFCCVPNSLESQKVRCLRAGEGSVTEFETTGVGWRELKVDILANER